MECREIRIRQLKSQSSQLRKSLKLYDELPNAQNRILEEIKLNEEIIKFLKKMHNERRIRKVRV